MRGAAAVGTAAGAAALLPGAPAASGETPLANLPSTRSTFRGVILGANTYSLPELKLNEALRAFYEIGFGEIELHPAHVEPRFGATPPYLPRHHRTPEEIAARKQAREKLRHWRLTVPLSYFEDIAKRIKAAGLFLYSYNMNFPDNFTDEEIDRSFQMTQALGCNVMTPVGSKQLLHRLNAFAPKYKIWLAIHNEPNSIRTIADFEEVLRGASRWSGICLDIGHFVAANSDPIACLNALHAKTYDLHIKDRKRNNGPSVPFGHGNTPIKPILSMDRDRNYHIPAQIEWEPRSPNRVEAVRQCFEYCKRALLHA